MTEAPLPTENSNDNRQYKNATKNFDNIVIADRLRTASWSNRNHPTGLVKPVYGYPGSLLTANAMYSYNAIIIISFCIYHICVIKY